MIRRILPKGKTFDNLTQEDVNKIMSHINSYKRKKLNNCHHYNYLIYYMDMIYPKNLELLK